MNRELIDSFIDAHVDEMLEDLKVLVRIDSQRQEAKPGMPYGEGPAKAIAAAEEILKKYGFATTNYDNYVVTGDFSDKEKKLDILAHLDVVPVTENWKETSPFEPVVKGDRIYGRGTADDKGPAIAAVYALRAIKECGIDLKKSVRVIFGSDEECGSSDLVYYYAKEDEAEMTFTPDAEFPVINIEKGRLHKVYTAKTEAADVPARVLCAKGGTKANVVPDTAIAVVKGITEEQVSEAAGKLDGSIAFLTESVEEGLKITAKGVAAHASTPEMGQNAISGLLSLIAELPLDDCDSIRKLTGLAKLFPMHDYSGTALGIEMEDEISGKLTMNLGVLSFDGEEITGEIDSRVPICGTDDTVTKVVAESFGKYGIQVDTEPMDKPHYVPADSELVSKLLDAYEDYSGVRGEPLAIGGGTYVHHLERGVAFGCMSFEVDNHMHGDDEFMEIPTLIMSAKVFADAILRICNEE